MLQAELDFFDEVTDVSGRLYPVPKDQRKGAAVDILRQLTVPRTDLYIPTNPECRLLAVIPESGTPMQSAAKVRRTRSQFICTDPATHRDGRPVKPDPLHWSRSWRRRLALQSVRPRPRVS